jgi:hypothetical protein
VFSSQADRTLTHTSHKDTEQSIVGASITLDWPGDHRMNDHQFARRYQFLPVRCSGRLISLQNEHPISMALQPFVGPWPLFRFYNRIQSRLDSLDRGWARRKVATYTQTIRKQTFMPWVGFQSTIPAFERAKIIHALDRAANVVVSYYLLNL